MKKRIGITFTTTNSKYYWSWFTAADLQNIELLELSSQKHNEEDFSLCHGFILTGGVDIHPSFYGGPTEYDNNPVEFQKDRDKFEEKIFRYSQANKKPLLGLCRGLQLVNVLQGGKLVQDLGVTANKKHRSHNNVDQQHEIRIAKDSLLFEITGSDVGTVNSAHHQVVDPDAIGENLKVNAWAATEVNIIEGLEFKDKTDRAFMLCVQWHPERMKDQQNPFSKNIKNSFLESVKSLP